MTKSRCESILLTVAVAVALAVSGCATPKYNYAPSSTEVSEPPLNTETVVFVGDTLVRQGRFTEIDTIELRADVNFGLLKSFTLTKGFYVKAGESNLEEFYKPNNSPGSGRVVKAALADPFQVIEAKKAKQELCVVTIYNLKACQETEFRRAKRSLASADSFQQALIYSGKVGSKINIGYREFSSNMARPAFNNDVEYDLSESTIIGYKGARIQVIEATNEHIKYKVLRNFNKAEY
jgi:hypothetical protein